MNSETIERETIRQYLLGRLDSADEIESKISDEIFMNDQFAELVESVEHEIIEAYDEGLLDSADRKSVEEYFLQSPERKAELRFFRILRGHFEAQATEVPESEAEVVREGRQHSRRRSGSSGAGYFWQRVLIYGQAAALIAICVVGVAYISGIQKQRRLLESQLSLEQTRLTDLGAQIARLSPSIVRLTLAVERSRSNAPLPEVELTRSTQQVATEIALRGPVAAAYDVQLETAAGGSPLWSAKSQPITSPSGDSRLLLGLPAGPLKAGVYSIVLSPEISGRSARTYYDFRVKVTE
jgi:hypothetical protein